MKTPSYTHPSLSEIKCILNQNPSPTSAAAPKTLHIRRYARKNELAVGELQIHPFSLSSHVFKGLSALRNNLDGGFW